MTAPDVARTRGPRVLYSFPHTLGRPGIATTAAHQVRGLVAAGVDVTVVCTSSVVEVPGARVVTTLEVLGRRIPHRAFLRTQRAYDHHDAVVARMLPRGGFDLVHVWPRACLRTLAVARRHGIPSLREAPSPHTATALRDAARAADERGLTLPHGHSHSLDDAVLAREQAEFAAADHVLVPSEYAAGTFVAEGTPADRVLRTTYGFDPQRFAPRERDAADRPLRAVFLGRGEPNKGLHVALDAWFASGLPDTGAVLVVAGVLWEPYADQLADQLAHPGVEVRGFVDDTPALLAGADLLLLPSYTEGSALVTYEALGSGCVPLVSTATGAPVRDGVDGFVHEVGDTATLTAQLRTLDADRGLLAAARAAAVARRDELTWDAAGRRLAEVYRSVVPSAARPAG